MLLEPIFELLKLKCPLATANVYKLLFVNKVYNLFS